MKTSKVLKVLSSSDTDSANLGELVKSREEPAWIKQKVIEESSIPNLDKGEI